MDLNSVFRQCTPCALYRTTLAVQCTFGAELCPQTACTLHSTTLTLQCTYGPEQAVCSDIVHHVHYIVHH